MRARLKEAKLRDLGGHQTKMSSTPPQPSSAPSSQPLRKVDQRDPKPGKGMHQGCYTCGSTSHFARRCPFKGRGGPSEASGRRNGRQIARITPESKLSEEGTQQARKQVLAELQRRLQDVEVQEALLEVTTMMHGITPGDSVDSVKLGVTPTAAVELEGEPVDALLDTGSPVTIVSLDHLL